MGFWDKANENKLRDLKERYEASLPFKDSDRVQICRASTDTDEINLQLSILHDRGFEVMNVFSRGDAPEFYIVFK